MIRIKTDTLSVGSHSKYSVLTKRKMFFIGESGYSVCKTGECDGIVVPIFEINAMGKSIERSSLLVKLRILEMMNSLYSSVGSKDCTIAIVIRQDLTSLPTTKNEHVVFANMGMLIYDFFEENPEDDSTLVGFRPGSSMFPDVVDDMEAFLKEATFELNIHEVMES